MRFLTRELTSEDILDISGWRYAAPYDVYNETGDGFLSGNYRGICDDHGALHGFFCWGWDAQIPAGKEIYDTDRHSIDFGMGMRPIETEVGNGYMAAECALIWLREAFHPPAFRLAVYAWNLRAQRMYARLGFQPFSMRDGFLLMSLDDRPWRDASMPLVSGITVYPGDPAFIRSLFLRKEENGFDASMITMSAHTGTHVDAPVHIGLPGGAETLTYEALNGAAQLIEWTTPDFHAIRGKRILLKNMRRGCNIEDAEALVSAGVTTVCSSVASIGCQGQELPVHTYLLQHGVTILENAVLDSFLPGWYQMRCLPLLLPGSDGAPARLFLREAP